MEVDRDSIAAQEMTVLPVPGGAIRTPVSCSRSWCSARGLNGAQRRAAGERVGLTEDAFVVDVQRAVGRFDEFGQQRMETAGKHEITVGRFVVAVEEPRCVPGAAARTLAHIEFRVTYRCGMLDGRDHRWAKIVGGQGES